MSNAWTGDVLNSFVAYEFPDAMVSEDFERLRGALRDTAETWRDTSTRFCEWAGVASTPPVDPRLANAMELLDEHQQEMPEGLYLRLANALAGTRGPEAS